MGGYAARVGTVSRPCSCDDGGAISDAVPRINAALQDKGLISSWLVRAGADTMRYLGVYTSGEAIQELWAWAAPDPEFRQLFADYLESIQHETGLLTDVFHLGSRGRYPESVSEADQEFGALMLRASGRRYAPGTTTGREAALPRQAPGRR